MPVENIIVIVEIIMAFGLGILISYKAKKYLEIEINKVSVEEMVSLNIE
jgi:hypothetical protein